MIELYKAITDKNLYEHEILYISKPRDYFVQINSYIDKNPINAMSPTIDNYFNLTFPSLIMIVSFHNGMTQRSPYDFRIAVVNEHPFIDTKIKENINLYHLPMPHIRDTGDICGSKSFAECTNALEVFNQFLNTKSKYFLSAFVQAYLLKNYPSLICGYHNHGFIIECDFFQEWENKYNIDNISDAPFMKIPITTSSLMNFKPYDFKRVELDI